MLSVFKHYLRLTVFVSCVACVSGCATLGTTGDPRDPFEGFNRQVTSFNDFMDRALIQPLIRLYRAITPEFLNKAISNIFDNLNDATVIINDFLQFKFKQMVSDLFRFIFNSILGLAGLFDVSTGMGLAKHNEDFGQTLGVWGFKPGPYLVVPLLGPFTLRDAVGRLAIGTWFNSPTSYIGDRSIRLGLMALNYVDYRADNLSATKLIGEAALDKYEFTKNIYLERRENLIHDRNGELPEGFEDLDLNSKIGPE